MYIWIAHSPECGPRAPDFEPWMLLPQVHRWSGDYPLLQSWRGGESMGQSGDVKAYISRWKILLVAVARCSFLALAGILLVEPSLAQSASRAAISCLPQRNAGQFDAYDRQLRLRPARRHDPHARRREAAHGHPVPKGAKNAPILLTRTPYDADELTSHDPREKAARILGPDPAWLRQCHRRDRRGRLHPRGAGCSRQIRLRRRLRDEPPPARAAESDAGRSRHRHLRHHRLAGEEHSRKATARSASSASPTTAFCR